MPMRFCDGCGQVLRQDRRESDEKFAARDYCGRGPGGGCEMPARIAKWMRALGDEIWSVRAQGLPFETAWEHARKVVRERDYGVERTEAETWAFIRRVFRAGYSS